MNLIESIIMGIIQGVAEFLPISSSGHLALGKQLFRLKDVDMTFDILLHIGTLVAVFIAFWADIKELIVEGFSIIRDLFINLGIAISSIFVRSDNTVSDDDTKTVQKTILKKDTTNSSIDGTSEKKKYRDVLGTEYRRFVALVIVSTIPTGIIGVLFNDAIEQFSATLIVPGICLLITGVELLLADNAKSGQLTAKDTSYTKAGIVGLAQAFATLPGISRSGTTITACLLCGFDKAFAVKYSFIMSIPAILGAAVLDIFDLADKGISTDMMFNYIVGTIVSGIVGYICIKTMLKVVKGKKFFGFSIYCFIVGAIAIACFFIL